MLVVNERITIPDSELEWSFVRSGGPGGQNVNKVASKAMLRWKAKDSPSLPDDVKVRLLEQQKGRLTTEGELIVTSQRFRDQPRNVDDCLDKLRELILQATQVPKKRRPTKPSRSSKARRVETKRHRSARKAARRVSED